MRGLIFGSMDAQVQYCGLATMGSSGFDLDGGCLDLGPYTSLLMTKNSKTGL